MGDRHLNFAEIFLTSGHWSKGGSTFLALSHGTLRWLEDRPEEGTLVVGL